MFLNNFFIHPGEGMWLESYLKIKRESSRVSHSNTSQIEKFLCVILSSLCIQDMNKVDKAGYRLEWDSKKKSHHKERKVVITEKVIFCVAKAVCRLERDSSRVSHHRERQVVIIEKVISQKWRNSAVIYIISLLMQGKNHVAEAAYNLE